jgi:ABC-2 type transport system ATP-binding protein
LTARRRATLVAAVAGTAVVIALLIAGRSTVRVESLTVPVDDATTLDAALYLPGAASADDPRPAVLLAHGFLGDRTSMDTHARTLADGGHVVLTWSSRGFGRSDGEVGLAAPDAEIADVSALVDLLATRAEVAVDAAGDPRVAIVGSSYGGGVALLAAAHEPRIDAVVAIAAWHDLATALAPDGPDGASGVVKTGWTALLFSARSTLGADADHQAGPVSPCGAFADAICDVYLDVAARGTMTESAASLLRRSSPAGVLDRIAAPTLLIQGQDDSLFDLGQAAANAAGIAADGTPVRQRWVAGGHERFGAAAWSDDVLDEVDAWLDRWLRERGEDPHVALTWTDTVDGRSVDVTDTDRASADMVRFRAGTDAALVVAAAPDAGVRGVGVDPARASPRTVTIFSPPGGRPAALSSFPGAGSFASLIPSTDLPGQHVAFTSAPLEDDLVLFGSPTLGLAVDADGDEARVFVKLFDVAGDGTARLIHRAVTPVRAVDPPVEMTVRLTSLAHRIAAGHRLRLTLATTDQAYANLTAPTAVTLDLDAIALAVPTANPVPAPSRAGWLVVGAVVIAAPVAIVVNRRTARRRRGDDGDDAPHVEVAELAAVSFRSVSKRYPDGKLAVDRLSLDVGAGQVLGLLGPNGAGKTSALRMLVGLTHPTSGHVAVLGERMRPGHPVLHRVGTLIEGPGFVPELSGRENLELYWRAGGRPLDEAELPWALEVAALGDAIGKSVRTYSHGMKQRLAIAQALLGRPELLVLDEPTDGLDPEQIRAMRRLLSRLGAEGHTVLVSSHLLAEVEQLCTHVAVMQSGALRAVGPVADVVGTTALVVIETDDPTAATALLRTRASVGSVEASGGTVVVEHGEMAVAELVALLVSGGIEVRAVRPRGTLEDAFLELTADDHPGAER